LGSLEDIESRVRELIAGDEVALAAFSAKQEEIGREQFGMLLRRLVLQVIDAFWLENLETMEYLRRSVSLRAYGQRDPLIEYRREGLAMFNAMQENIAHAIREALPRIQPADDARIRAEEERVRRAMVAASEGEAAPQAPVVKSGKEYGRNDEVTIRKGEETQTLKYKKAEPLLAEGWIIEAN
jgi:preprotein translocase subunit SecA